MNISKINKTTRFKIYSGDRKKYLYTCSGKNHQVYFRYAYTDREAREKFNLIFNDESFFIGCKNQSLEELLNKNFIIYK